MKILAGLKQKSSDEIYANRSFFNTIIDRSYNAMAANINDTLVTKTPAIKYDVSIDIILLLLSLLEKYERPELNGQRGYITVTLDQSKVPLRFVRVNEELKILVKSSSKKLKRFINNYQLIITAVSVSN